jgi:hypothetical protein
MPYARPHGKGKTQSDRSQVCQNGCCDSAAIGRANIEMASNLGLESESVKVGCRIIANELTARELPIRRMQFRIHRARLDAVSVDATVAIGAERDQISGASSPSALRERIWCT